MKHPQGKLFVVSGPSGVGKTTLVAEFLKQYGSLSRLSRVVTYTTKVARFNELHGVDYHFIHQKEFERKVRDGFFLEWSGEYGACYGTPVSILNDLSKGSSFILIIDRAGATQIIQKYPDTILIWIHVLSMDILANRLQSRKADSFEQIQTRLFLAKKEIDQELHSPMYHYHIENESLECALRGLFNVVSQRLLDAQNNIK